MLTPIPSQSDFLEDLSPKLLILRDGVVLAAHREYNQLPAEYRLKQNHTSKAGALQRLMIHHAKHAFGSDKTVSFVPAKEEWMIHRGRYEIGLRFKKLDGIGVPSNAVTKRQKAVAAQRPLLELPFPRINVGWHEMPDGSIDAMLSMSCSIRGVSWCAALREDGAYDSIGTLLLPFSDGLPQFIPPADHFDVRGGTAPAPERRVRPRVPGEDDDAVRRVRPSGEDTEKVVKFEPRKLGAGGDDGKSE